MDMNQMRMQFTAVRRDTVALLEQYKPYTKADFNKEVSLEIFHNPDKYDTSSPFSFARSVYLAALEVYARSSEKFGFIDTLADDRRSEYGV